MSTPYRVPARPTPRVDPARSLPHIDWVSEEISYGRTEQRAKRVFDGEGRVILDLVGPACDLKVALWSIVAGAIAEDGGVTVTIRCESGGLCGRELRLDRPYGSSEWLFDGTILERHALAPVLSWSGAPSAALEVQSIVDAIGPTDD